jgi:hypothetical protein
MPQSHRPPSHDPEPTAPVDPVQPAIEHDATLPVGPNYLLTEDGEVLTNEDGVPFITETP